MQFTMNMNTLLLALGVASTALAAPTTKSTRQADSWTITSLSRTCDDADTTCTWTFGIDNGVDNTPCTFDTTGSPASQADGGPATCGVYTVTSSWSGQYGEDNGFTTLAVVDYDAGLLVWPGYSDADLAGGEVVADQTYTPSPV
ncbi:hypothetical protein BDV18DRAFT_144639 [Aspergillus unguis]